MSSRIFVSVDSSSVTLVNLDGPSLTLDAMRAVRSMATRHRERFTQMLATGSLEQDGIRLGRDGLFVGNRQIAEFAQVVETLPREAVREIRGPVVVRGSTLGTLIGAWLGFTLGAVPALGGADAVASSFGGITLGGWLGHHWSNHTVEGVVYVSP